MKKVILYLLKDFIDDLMKSLAEKVKVLLQKLIDKEEEEEQNINVFSESEASKKS